MGSKHLAHGACRHLTREAVDVDLLIFMLLAHGVAALLQRPTEMEESQVIRRGPESLPPPSAPITAPTQIYDPSSQWLDVLTPFRLILWGPRTGKANDTKVVSVD